MTNISDAKHTLYTPIITGYIILEILQDLVNLWFQKRQKQTKIQIYLKTTVLSILK